MTTVNNNSNSMGHQVKPYESPTTSTTTTMMPLLILDERDTYWGVADRDVPILIGAAAGAVGLVFLILGAVFIWYCCQYVFKRDKSLYSLENESERGSVSSENSSVQPFSDAVIWTGKKDINEAINAGNMKRSRSVPLSVHKSDHHSRRTKATKGGGGGSTAFSNQIFQYDNVQVLQAGGDIAHQKLAMATGLPMIVTGGGEERSLDVNRSHLYSPSSPLTVVEEFTTRLDDHYSTGKTVISEAAELSLKCRSLPWKKAGRGSDAVLSVSERVAIDRLDEVLDVNDEEEEDEEEEDSLGELSPKVNFTKKRKNRMRNDSAAAIALNKSGAAPGKTSFLHGSRNNKDTDSLVANESVVVYDERTAL